MQTVEGTQNQEIILRQRRADRYAENREEVKERERKRAATPRRRAMRRENYLQNREKSIEAARRWVLENRERRRATERAWYKKNPAYQLLRHAKGRAKRLCVPIDISVDDVVVPDVCPILGIPLMAAAGKAADNSPTIDRVVPSLGYVKGNVAVISNRANRIKNDGTLDELRAIVAYLEARLQ